MSGIFNKLKRIVSGLLGKVLKILGRAAKVGAAATAVTALMFALDAALLRDHERDERRRLDE